MDQKMQMPNSNATAQNSTEYDHWRKLCGIQLKDKLKENVSKRQKIFEDVVTLAAIKISRDNTLEIISNPPKFKVSATITNEATARMCEAIDAWPGVHLTQCKKLPPVFKKYWRIADNWWNRQKGKWFGDLFFQPILHYSLHQYCKRILIKKKNDIAYDYLFYIFLQEIIISKVSFKKARPNPLIFDLAIEKSTKLQSWFTIAGNQHGVKWEVSTSNKTKKAFMNKYSQQWVKDVLQIKEARYKQFSSGHHEDISRILNVFPAANGRNSGGSIPIKRDSGSRSHSKSNSYHSQHSHSKSNSHYRNNSNNSNRNIKCQDLMDEKDDNNASPLSPDQQQDIPSPITNTNTNTTTSNHVTAEQRAASQQDYARLRQEWEHSQMKIQQQADQLRTLQQALNDMQRNQMSMSQVYPDINGYPYNYPPNVPPQDQYQFDLQFMQFQQQLYQEQQYQSIKQEIKQQEEDEEMQYNDYQDYSGYINPAPASINQPEFLPQPPRYSMSSVPDMNGMNSGPLPPPLKNDAVKGRRPSYCDVQHFVIQPGNKSSFNRPQIKVDDGSVHSSHCTNGGNSTLTTASQTTTTISNIHNPNSLRQSTPTTAATGMSTPSGSDTSHKMFFGRHNGYNRHQRSSNNQYAYDPGHNVRWPLGMGSNNNAVNALPNLHVYGNANNNSYYGYTHPVPPNHNQYTLHQQQLQQDRRSRRAAVNKSASLDVASSNNGSVDIKSVSMTSQNNNSNNYNINRNNNANYNNNNNGNSQVDLGFGLPPPPMNPQQINNNNGNNSNNNNNQSQLPISPQPRQSMTLLPPPPNNTSRRPSAVSSHHSHQSLSASNNGAITPPDHSNNNSLNINTNVFDIFDNNMNMNMNSNSNSNSNNNNDNNNNQNSNQLNSSFADPVPFDQGMMNMDPNDMNMMNNILAMNSGPNGFGSGGLMSDGMTSSQEQNRIYGGSVTNMSISDGNGMSISNCFVNPSDL